MRAAVNPRVRRHAEAPSRRAAPLETRPLGGGCREAMRLKTSVASSTGRATLR